MSEQDNDTPHSIITAGDREAILHLKSEIAGGKPWYTALLEAIGLWESTEETTDERKYTYLIAGEAFDWLTLAERLCREVRWLIPEAELNALLFRSRPPLDLPPHEFKKLIGDIKYHQYLNYFYGITAEEALIWAVEEEVRKERRLSGLLREADTAGEAYRRIYGSTRAVLLRQFRKERRYPQRKSITVTQMKEFTYWLFRHRLMKSDKARVASDTRKALDWLENRGYFRQAVQQELEREIIDVPVP